MKLVPIELVPKRCERIAHSVIVGTSLGVFKVLGPPNLNVRFPLVKVTTDGRAALED